MSVEIVKKMLQMGANVNAQDNTGFTPLHRAVQKYKNVEIAEILLEYGAFVDHQNNARKATPLMMAIQNRCGPDLVQILIKNGANLEINDVNGWTALIYAAYYPNCLPLAEVLVDSGAVIDVQTGSTYENLKKRTSIQAGTTPLMLACAKNDEDLARLLLSNGANLNVKNTKGISARQLISDTLFRRLFDNG